MDWKAALLLATCASLMMLAPVAAGTDEAVRVAQRSPTATNSPVRGLTMQQVEARFGSPVRRRAPVGDPPITRWEYADFIVYFEFKRVIHTVKKR